MRDKALTSVRRYGMLPPGSRVVAALSGGADSVALLHFLLSVQKELGLTLTACHLNHNLRGEEALRDQRFCEQLCQKWGVPLTVFSVDVTAWSQSHNMGVEEGARALRYRLLAEQAGPEGKIATGHHLGDQAETVLFRLARGTGLKGLTGIPPVRGQIIRPLLYCTRQEIEQYCRQNGLAWVTDSTNLADSYTRNRLRHQVIPELERLNPRFYEAVARIVSILEQEEHYLSLQTDRALEQLLLPQNGEAWRQKEAPLARQGKQLLLLGSRQALAELHPAMQHRAVHRLLERQGAGEDAKTAGLCLQTAFKGTGMVQLGPTLFFFAGRNHFGLCKSQDMRLTGAVTSQKEGLPVVWDYKRQNSLLLPDCREISLVLLGEDYEQTENFQKNCGKFLKNRLDCDKISGTLRLRHRNEGDRYHPAGRSGSRTLKKLCNDVKMPLEQRAALWVLEDEEGILWAEEFGVARRAAAGEQCRNAAEIRLRPVKMGGGFENELCERHEK